MEKAPKKNTGIITDENYKETHSRLNNLIWDGKYDEALPLADKVFEYLSNNGGGDKAIIMRASNYYSAASRLWKEDKVKASVPVGKYMNTALRALENRIKTEIEKQGGEKEGMIAVSLNSMSADELDVMQTVYRRAGEMADKVPLVKPMRELLLKKEDDPIRDFDAAALTAIRAGLKKSKETEDVQKGDGHTEIFLLCGAFDIAMKYDWDGSVKQRAEKIFELADAYDWPEIEDGAESENDKSGFGQAARVARHVSEVAAKVGDEERLEKFQALAKKFAELVPDQKAKL